MVDIFRITPAAFNRMPDWYPYMVKVPRLWGLGLERNTRTATRHQHSLAFLTDSA
jgi:hypothetical protein